MPRIVLNTKELEITTGRTLFEVKKQWHENNYPDINEEDIVTIVDGFASMTDVVLHDGQEISLIAKGEVPNEEELESLMVSRHTPGVHKAVKMATVAVCGLGGLGSTVAIALARIGVGKLHLIDFDVVEPSNLNRQQYKIKHLGAYKTQALSQEIAEINPYIEVEVTNTRISFENAPELLKNDDIICECFDNPVAKAQLTNSVRIHLPETPLVAASGLAGYESSNTIKTRKLSKNFYIAGDLDTSAQIGRGLMAPRVLVCAGHQANQVLRLILGEKDV
ncbi:MAG: sulfur carrier protein ThiS adenylyltransferase ThiF [Candidatus Ancillula sp.]|jgi:sulfur carrier protein ThiS adenylyltransferase|nr:sulfur carrier protein ThiS adenylyltransferase ThiF [Candidatus Ancillula sp.]